MNIDNLQELLDAVISGNVKNNGIMSRAFGDEWPYCYDTYHGSLDAAKLLHDAVLPVAKWQVWHDNAEVWFDGPEDYSTYMGGRCYPHNPARAWLIAIIKALIAQEKDKQ